MTDSLPVDYTQIASSAPVAVRWARRNAHDPASVAARRVVEAVPRLLADHDEMARKLIELETERRRLRAAIDGEGGCTCRPYFLGEGDAVDVDEDELCPEHGTVASLRGGHDYAVRLEAGICKLLGPEWEEPFHGGDIVAEVARRLGAC